MKTVFCLLAFTFCLVSYVSADEGEVEKKFIEHKIDQDVIKPVPSKKLQVHYPKTKQIVNLGNELAPENVKDAPEVTYEADPKAFYTLSFSDPDASKPWQHWLVVNIPGSDLSKGEVLDEYVGAGPPKGSGLHRYVFLLFKQQEKTEFHEQKHSKTDGDRTKLPIQKFAEKYKLGNPIEGNFFLAQYDDYVPELHKQFKKN